MDVQHQARLVKEVASGLLGGARAFTHLPPPLLALKRKKGMEQNRKCGMEEEERGYKPPFPFLFFSITLHLLKSRN